MADNSEPRWALKLIAPADPGAALISLLGASLGQQPQVQRDGDQLALVLRFQARPEPALVDKVEGMLANLSCQEAPLWTRGPQDTGWSQGWRAFYQGGRPTPRLAVTPPWGTPDPEALCCVTLAPRGAFGAGFHVTSRQILTLLDELLLERGDSLAGLRALDLGCGSGLLSVMMARLGAQVVALDRSPRARLLTTQNAARNGVQSLVQVRDASLAQVGDFDLVMANLGPVARLLPELAARAQSHLLVSCLHPPQRAQALRDCAPMTLAQELVEDSWLALRWRRTS